MCSGNSQDRALWQGGVQCVQGLKEPVWLEFWMVWQWCGSVRGRKMEKPNRQSIGLYHDSNQKPFNVCEQVGVMPCGKCGALRLQPF